MRIEGMHYFCWYSTHKNTLKSARGAHDTAEYTVPVLWHNPKKSGRMKPPNGKKGQKQSLLWPWYDARTPVRHGLRSSLDTPDNLGRKADI
jgi:hypothetical protein